MKDSMNESGPIFDGIENQIIFNYQVAVSQYRQFFFIRDATKSRIAAELQKSLFDLHSHAFCCCRVICCNIANDLLEIILGRPQEPYFMVRPFHGSSSEGLSSPAQGASLCRRSHVGPVQPQAC